MILAIDAGNTRVKWGVHDGAGWMVQGVAGCGEAEYVLQALPEISGLRHIIISSVAGAAVNTALQAALDELDLPAHWIKPQAACCGVNNGYADPAQLGSDRWAALIAAWHGRHEACVVVSAGTALTVDALSSRGEFIGGLIVPGLVMMKTALAANTAGVGLADGQLREFPVATGDGVHSGALRAMAGAVESMCASLTRREGRMPALLLSGGDASALQGALSGAGEIRDNLVLDGLVLIARENP